MKKRKELKDQRYNSERNVDLHVCFQETMVRFFFNRSNCLNIYALAF